MDKSSELKTMLRKGYANVANAMLGSTVGEDGFKAISDEYKSLCRQFAEAQAELGNGTFEEIYPDEWAEEDEPKA